MKRFFCLGDLDTVSGFQLAGVKGASPTGHEEALQDFAGVIRDSSVVILLITEEIAQGMQRIITGHRMSGKLPMIVEIPDNLSDSFQGRSLMDSIRQAIGISL